MLFNVNPGGYYYFISGLIQAIIQTVPELQTLYVVNALEELLVRPVH
jgi:hypothetical protein